MIDDLAEEERLWWDVVSVAEEKVEAEEDGQDDGQEEEDGGGGAHGRDLRAVARRRASLRPKVLVDGGGSTRGERRVFMRRWRGCWGRGPWFSGRRRGEIPDPFAGFLVPELDAAAEAVGMDHEGVPFPAHEAERLRWGPGDGFVDAARVEHGGFEVAMDKAALGGCAAFRTGGAGEEGVHGEGLKFKV